MKKILVRGPDTVGSFVLATPFFRELRKNFPHDYIVLSVKQSVFDLAKNCPYVNKVLIYNKNIFLNIKEFRKEKFDTVFLLSGSFESAFVCFIAGIKNRIGYPHDHRGFLLTSKIKEIQKKHYVNYILYILESLGYSVSDKTPEVYISDEENTKYDYIFSDDKPVIGITYASIAEDARYWPKEYIEELVNLLVEKNFKIVLLGKTNKVYQIKETENITDLVNKTSLSEFVSIVKKLSCYISVATGGIHIAAVLGINTIGLYIPGDEFGWSPVGKNVFVITKDVSCVQCNPHKMKYCKNNVCMKSIKPQEVEKQVLNFFTKSFNKNI